MSSASVLSALLMQAYIPASVTLASLITTLRFLPSFTMLILSYKKKHFKASLKTKEMTSHNKNHEAKTVQARLINLHALLFQPSIV